MINLKKEGVAMIKKDSVTFKMEVLREKYEELKVNVKKYEDELAYVREIGDYKEGSRLKALIHFTEGKLHILRELM